MEAKSVGCRYTTNGSQNGNDTSAAAFCRGYGYIIHTLVMKSLC